MTYPILNKPPKKREISLEAYLDREAKAAHKSSYHNGIIVKIAGAKAQHNEICANILVALKVAAKGSKTVHRIYTSDQKVYIKAENTVVYPDAVVVAIAPEFWNGREDLITNPLLIVEVLSKSTKNFDRGGKFMFYQTIPSFSEYILIEQEECKVEVWTKIGEDKWQRTEYKDINDSIILNSMKNIKICTSDIYENISL